MTRQTGAFRPWSKTVAPETIDLATAVTVTTATTTLGLGGLGTTQVGELFIQNLGLQDVFVGPKATVSASNGIKIPGAQGTGTTQMGGLLVLQTGADIGLITSAGSSDCRVMRTKHT